MWVTLFMALTGSVVSAQQFERGGTRPEETGRLVDTQPPAPSGRGLGPVYRTPDPKDLSLLHDWYPYRTIPPFGNPAIADAPDVVYPGSARFRITDGTKLPAELKIQLDRRSEFPAGYYIVHFRDGVDEDAHQLLDGLTDEIVGPDGRVRARWYVPNRALVAFIDSWNTYDEIV